MTAIHPVSGISEAERAGASAAAVEQGATHLLAQAIVREAQMLDWRDPDGGNRSGTLAGTGIEAQVNGERILICAVENSLRQRLPGKLANPKNAGQTVVLRYVTRPYLASSPSVIRVA